MVAGQPRAAVTSKTTNSLHFQQKYPKTILCIKNLYSTIEVQAVAPDNLLRFALNALTPILGDKRERPNFQPSCSTGYC